MKINKFSLFLITAVIALSACAAPASPQTNFLPTLESSSAGQEIAASQAEASAAQNVFTEIYKNVNPGVVSIDVYFKDGSGGQGSGFMLDSAGHILTNFHVIENAQKIEVIFSSGYRAEGIVTGTDLYSDLAVLSVTVPAQEIHPLVLGSSKEVKVGQTVVAIGNPYGLSGTMTVGIVSARGRLLESMQDSASGSNFSAADLIQTDAAINPGNSGGPLLDLNGEVIGVNRAIRTNGDDGVATLSNSGIGFAVPIDIVKRVTPYLIENGSYAYPYLGIVSREALTLNDREILGLGADVQGAYVISAVAGGPAAQAGIIGGTEQTDFATLPPGGDLITAVDGHTVRSFSDLLSYLVTYKSPGDEVKVSVLRESRELTFSVVLTSRPD